MNKQLLVLIFQNFLLLRQANAETQSYRSLTFSSKMVYDVIVNSDDVIYSLTSRSTSKCSSTCLENVLCVSFVFNRDSLNCTILSTISPETVPTGTPVQLYGQFFVRREFDAGVLKSTTVTVGGRQYRFFTYPFVTRTVAKDICGTSGAYLLEINSQAEWDFILLKAPTGLFYTGATDEGERGVFKWETSGETMTMAFTSLSTNNQTVDCIALGKYNSFMTLIASECTMHFMAACEKEV